MTVIHKILLDPGGARVAGRPLSVGIDGQGRPSCWFIVGQPCHRIAVYGTGWDLADYPGEFIGTFVTESLVFHVFDEGPTP
jgi:hypothetical protein